MTVGNQTHIVTTGDKLHADTEIVDIESKQVTLQTSGQQRTLRLNTTLWLNTSVYQLSVTKNLLTEY